MKPQRPQRNTLSTPMVPTINSLELSKTLPEKATLVYRTMADQSGIAISESDP